MLRKTQKWFVPALVWMLCLAPTGASSQADDGAASAESRAYKIGVVDVNVVFNKYQKQIDERADLEKEKEKQDAKLDVLRKKIEAAQKTLDENKETLSREEAEDLQESIASDLNDLEAEFTRAQRNIDRKIDKISATIFSDVRKAVRDVGSKENYHLILEVGLASRSNVLYHSTTLNMTQKVLDYLNSNYKKP